MTPIRALIAGVLAAILFGAGLFIVASFADARVHDLPALLSPARTPFDLWCFLAAWGGLAAGILGVLAAFFAFIAPEEEDDPRFRRRGFPKSLPVALIAIGLGLAYVSFCCALRAEAPIAVPVALTAGALAPDFGPDLVDKPAMARRAEPVVAAPTPLADAASFQWRYMDPLMRDDDAIWSGAGRPFTNDPEAERLLCGKAWVAVSGSASEEGPPDRNADRARHRTQRAMEDAARWLKDHPACGETLVLGLDLGQHVATTQADDGAASAYQRQVLVVSRGFETGDPTLDAATAIMELKTFLALPENRAALLAGRRFLREPLILAP